MYLLPFWLLPKSFGKKVSTVPEKERFHYFKYLHLEKN